MSGADRAILLEVSEGQNDIEPLTVAKLLAAVVNQEQPRLILVGKQAIDNDMNATGQMLAGLLGWAQATFASKLELGGDNAVATQEVDGGLRKIKLKLPAVVSVDLRLNEPRYASLMNIMKAKKKPLEVKSAADLGVNIVPRLTVLKTYEPAGRKAGVRLASVDELIQKLTSELEVS
jgi:electron transfer flavoprotein beta subunit